MTWTTPGGKYYKLYADMANQTHLLIGGAAGSGKSVTINAIVTTILHDAPAEDELVLIDPKRVELSEYRNLPHVRMYASEPADILDALRRTLQTIDARYKTMQRNGQREFTGSHLYLIIDELTDLLTTASIKREAAELIQRICQIGRAARCHCIAGTQHIPTVPTSIRCNFDARLALRTTCAQDSRNIAGVKGAETLPSPRLTGKAYGYYRNAEGIALYELPTYTEAEHRRIVDHWRQYTRFTWATA